jgi:hypothetical protein
MVSSGDVPSDFNLASFFVRPDFRVFQHNRPPKRPLNALDSFGRVCPHSGHCLAQEPQERSEEEAFR